MEESPLFLRADGNGGGRERTRGPPWIPPSRVPRGKNDSLNILYRNFLQGRASKLRLEPAFNEENTNGFALSLTAEIGVANFFIGFHIKNNRKNWYSSYFQS